MKHVFVIEDEGLETIQAHPVKLVAGEHRATLWCDGYKLLYLRINDQRLVELSRFHVPHDKFRVNQDGYIQVLGEKCP